MRLLRRACSGSNPRSNRLGGWSGGGSYRRGAACAYSDCGLLLGIGGGESPPLVLGLVGGLLKGDVVAWIDRACSLWPFWGAEEEGFGGMTGFSARLMGGGTGLGGSRLNSPDRRGGGGDGGLDRGVNLDSGVGEWLWLGALDVCGGAVFGVTIGSGLRKVERSPWSSDSLPLGGDCGGCTLTDGGRAGRGSMGGTGSVADRNGEWARGSSRVGSLMAAMEGFGLVAGRGGGGLKSGFPFCTAEGLTGETDRGGRDCGCGGSFLDFPIFSKCDSREETGRWNTVRASKGARE